MSEEYIPEEYINPNDFIGDLLPSYRSLITSDQAPIGQQIQQLLSNFIWYHDTDYYQLVTAYIMMSQKWCKVCPIMFCYGLPGSGKSSVSIFSAYLHNQTYTFSSSDTFPSVRNSLDHMRWIDKEKQYERDGAILCWDNLGSHDLARDPRLLQLMLYGYNRSTDKIQIANNDGTNRVFHVFCPKIISSVEPLHQDPEFQELARRLLIINHKKVDHRTDIHLESLQDYDWSDFPKLYFDFWHEKMNCIQFVSLRKSLSHSRKWTIPPTLKTITIDIAATHCLVYKCSTDESIQLFENYWQKIMNQNLKSELEECLETFMQIEFKKIQGSKQTYIKHSQVKDYLTMLLRDGVISTAESREFKRVLRKLGYVSNKFGWFQNEEVK